LYTKFDIRWGYNNVWIKEGDEWKAVFITNEGLFEPTVMFFRLANSLATFQTMMNSIFSKEIAEQWLTVYMDNMAIHTKGKQVKQNYNTSYTTDPACPESSQNYSKTTSSSNRRNAPLNNHLLNS
jgi:hypothetical protein